jgi:hypothetical protein
MTRLCIHPGHAQYGLGHIPGPPLAVEYAAVPVALPATYTRTVQAPVLNQGSTPECEGYTAVTGRRITQSPLGQDGFGPDDIFRLGGGGPNGATTPGIEAALLSPGALCNAGPDSGHRKPVASCQNISTLTGLKSALMAEQFAGLAVAWDESWFSPRSNGVLPPRSGSLAGYHIFDVWGWSDDGTLPVGAPLGVPAPGVPAVGGQNSWGTAWGKGGFFWLPYSMLESSLSAYTQIAIPPPVPYSRSAVNYTAIEPVRVLDTRANAGLSGLFHTGAARTLKVAGVLGIPTNAIAIAGNLTVTQASAAGYLAIGPAPHNTPSTSTLNFPLHDDRANCAVTGLAADGSVSITYVSGTAGATTHVILDITGYFS